MLAPNERLRIYAVDTEGKDPAARAVLLMRYRDSGAGSFGARTLSGLSNYYTSLFGPVIEPGDSDAQQILDTLAAAIAGDEIRWDVIDLHPLAVDSPVFPRPGHGLQEHRPAGADLFLLRQLVPAGARPLVRRVFRDAALAAQEHHHAQEKTV